MTVNEYEAIRVEMIAKEMGNRVSKQEFVSRLERCIKFNIQPCEDNTESWLECTTPGFHNQPEKNEICIWLGGNEFVRIEFNTKFTKGTDLIETEPDEYMVTIEFRVIFYTHNQCDGVMTRVIPCEITCKDGMT